MRVKDGRMMYERGRKDTGHEKITSHTGRKKKRGLDGANLTLKHTQVFRASL